MNNQCLRVLVSIITILSCLFTNVNTDWPTDEWNSGIVDDQKLDANEDDASYEPQALIAEHNTTSRSSYLLIILSIFIDF